MFVVIQHKIKDPQAFWAASEKAEQDGPPPPSGTENTHFFWSADDTAAICVYRTESLDALREWMDTGLGEASEQSYFIVNTDVSAGLPS